MNDSLKYIENILLEILDRPRFWLETGHSHKLNIGTFDTQKTALAFLQQYKERTFVKGQKIILLHNNEQLHLVVRNFKYGSTNQNLKITPNTTIEFIYRQISFCDIKWPKVIIKNAKQSHSEKTTPALSSSSDTEDFEQRECQSIDNLHKISTGKNLTLENTNLEDIHFRSTIFICLKKNSTKIVE